MATPTQAFSAPKLTSDIVNLSDYIHKKQVWNKFIKTFNDQYDLAAFMRLGNFGPFKRPVEGDSYYWQENDIFQNAPIIGTVVDNTGFITVTYGVGSYTDAGSKSFGKTGQIVQFANYLFGRIQAKSTTTPNAHTITVTPLGTTAAGVAITSAQLIVGLAAGQPLTIFSSAFANGSFGQTESSISTISEFGNQLQTASEDFKVDFNEMHNMTWVPFEFASPDAGGESRYRYYLKQTFETEIAIMRQIMLGAIAGPGGSTVDAAGATVPATLGLYPAMEKYSTYLPWSGSALGLDYFNTVENFANKNYVTDGFRVYNGMIATQAQQGLQIAYKAGRPDGSTTEIDPSLTRLKLGSLTYDFMDLKVLSDPLTLGKIGNKYKSSMMFVPNGKTMLSNGEEEDFFGIRYKPRMRSTRESFLGFSTLGFNGAVATSTEDIKQFHYKATFGAEWHGLRQMILANNPQL
jgi:hypothetical protein